MSPLHTLLYRWLLTCSKFKVWISVFLWWGHRLKISLMYIQYCYNFPVYSDSSFHSHFQGTINAQMLAQRQRELLSNHLRQRQQQQQQVQQAQQVQQQRSMAMRGPGLNLPPNMAAGGMSNPRIPQGNPQQFPYPPSYGTSTGLASPPPSTSPFSSPLSPSLPSLPPNPQLHMHGTSSSSSTSSSSQMMMGNTSMMGGQYGAVLSPQMQHSAFQFPNSGTASTTQPNTHFTWPPQCVCVCVRTIVVCLRDAQHHMLFNWGNHLICNITHWWLH